jgi:uncharacterized protein with PQ loop repeat
MGITEVIGYAGALMLALCGAPQLYKCFKDKHARGLSWGLVLLWLGGEVLTIIYLLMAGIMTAPLIVNYGFNLIVLVGIFKYKLFPTDGIKNNGTKY